MRRTVAISSLLFSFVFLVFSNTAFAQIGVGISVNFGPPPLPVYEQPLCPVDGYLWTPGYWAYDDGVTHQLLAGVASGTSFGTIFVANR